MAPQTTMGDIVAECELSAGRPDAAEARCGQALEKVRGHARGTCHVEETLTSVCTAQGKDAEAIEHARAALASRDAGLHFRLLEARALCAARQGRWYDAAWVLGFVDRLYELRGEVRWPLAQRRRTELDAQRVGAMADTELQRGKAQGTDGDLDAAFERALGSGQLLQSAVS
jgi:hypothetical protein